MEKESFTKKFRKRFKKQITTGIVAAFAFLVALTWREPIKNSIDLIIEKLGLTGQSLYIEFLSAIAIIQSPPPAPDNLAP